MTISLRNITKKYGIHHALNGISLEVEKGSIHGFLGPNGAGKTTTMNIISGLLKASSGTIEVSGHDIEQKPMLCRRLVGYLPETPPLYLDQQVKEFLSYLALLRGVHKKRLKERLDDIYELCSLQDVSSRLIGNLSKGFKQRVALAGALIHEPEVVILDEPTNGLDPMAISQMRDLIKNLKQNHTVLLSSHLLNEVSDMCDNITFIKEGTIVQTGSQDNILDSAKADRKMNVVVEQMSDLTLEKLKKWKLIKDLEVIRDQKRSRLLISFSDEHDHRSEVSKILIETGAIPIEMKMDSPDLEQAYKGLIN